MLDLCTYLVKIVNTKKKKLKLDLFFCCESAPCISVLQGVGIFGYRLAVSVGLLVISFNLYNIYRWTPQIVCNIALIVTDTQAVNHQRGSTLLSLLPHMWFEHLRYLRHVGIQVTMKRAECRGHRTICCCESWQSGHLLDFTTAGHMKERQLTLNELSAECAGAANDLAGVKITWTKSDVQWESLVTLPS